MNELRARIRRVQLAGGLGFLMLVVGTLVSTLLFQALGTWLQPTAPGLGAWVASALVRQLWLVALLPLAFLAVSRAADVRVWSGPLAAVLTGEVFMVALAALSGTLGVFGVAEHLVSAAGAVLLSNLAIRRGQQAAGAASARAAQVAQANQETYASRPPGDRG